MGSPNTHREALIAETLGDLQGLIERVEALNASLPAELLERASADIPKAVDELPERVRAAAREAVGPVTAAAILAARSGVSGEIEKAVAESTVSLRSAATAAVKEVADAAAGRQRALTVAALAIVALVSGTVGYAIGRVDRAGVQSRGEALALRSDGEDWLRIASANSDLNATLREYCRPGSKSAYEAQGVRACSVPLWLEPPTAPAGSAAAARGASFGAWIGERSAWFWAGLALIGGIFTRKLLIEFGRLTSVRWLLDL